MSERILTLDIGTSKLVLGEFFVKKGSPLVLNRYVIRPMEVGSLEATGLSLDTLAEPIREMMAEGGIKPAPLYAMLSGSSVFPRFVKLPPVEKDKIDEMVVYEASENLPFPIDEVVWDYQLISDETETEIDALIVATKRETATDLAMCAEKAGLTLSTIDAIPFALYNCVCLNHPESEGSTMVLDIGARSTNLIFVEGTKIFTRTITVAGNTITNEIARSLSISVEEAEQLKKEIGFVALGGTYAVIDDEMADKVSKVIRNVVTRLHTEVTRSINFYRSQQGGSAPTRLLLTGGASQTRHMDTFFSEKLGAEVEYLNPFVQVSIADALRDNLDELFLMAPSVGLALRARQRCSVEINLMPPALIAARRFSRRLPFFGVAVVGLVATLLCWFSYAKNLQTVYENQNNHVKARLSKIESEQRQLQFVTQESSQLVEKANYLTDVVASRGSFVYYLEAIRGAMLKDTWIRSFELEPSREEGEAPTLRIEVCGFKRELDSLEAGKSAGEMLLANLLNAGDLFVAEGSRVEREISKEDDKLAEIHLRVKLAVQPGTVQAFWRERGGDQ